MQDYYQRPLADAYKDLLTSEKGLSQQEAEKRIAEQGLNSIAITPPPPYILVFFHQFTSFLPWLLVGIGLLALTAAHVYGLHEHYIDAGILFLILLTNTLLGAYQDYHSIRSAHKLDHLTIPPTRVRRDDKDVVIETQYLVVGDILILSEGMRVPADARITRSESLQVNESVITGESLPVDKNNRVLRGEHSLHEHKNTLFKDTYITRGWGEAVVVRTSNQTEVGRMSRNIKHTYSSPFNKELDLAVNKITIISTALILLIVLLYLFTGNDVSGVLLLATALLIGSLPEGLPTVVMASIARSAKKLLSKKVLVKRNMLLETMGSVDVVCFDKTGTLTTNKLSVSEIFVAGTNCSFSALDSVSELEFSRAALIANNAHITEKGYVGEPVDIAFIDYFNDQNYDIIEFRENNQRVKFTPFSTESKQETVTINDGKTNSIYSKGVPEHILSQCTHLLKAGKVVLLTDKLRAQIEETIRGFSEKAYMNIAFMKETSKHKVFIGVTGLFDPPKKEVKEIISQLYQAGIDVKMITGDAQNTALATAKKCGFKNPSSIDWKELRDLSAEKLVEAVKNNNVFSRIEPEKKLVIVRVLKELGYRVAITGDGVNDVPALKEADIGITIGSKSSDMSREAADVIVLGEDLGLVLESIKEGRTIFSNTRKIMNYFFTSHLGHILLLIAGFFVGVMPFLAIQLLWVNFVSAYAPALALGADPASHDVMKKRPTGRKEHLLTKSISAHAFFHGINKALFLSALFFSTYFITGELVLSQTITFTFMVLWHIVRVTSIRYLEGTSVFNNPRLVVALGIPILIQVIILYTPLGSFFGVTPLHPFIWGVLFCALIGAIYTGRVVTKLVDHVSQGREDDY